MRQRTSSNSIPRLPWGVAAAPIIFFSLYICVFMAVAVTAAVTETVTAAVTVTVAATVLTVSLSLRQSWLLFLRHWTIPEKREPVFLTKNETGQGSFWPRICFLSKHETGQGSFWPKVRPAKADYCSGAAVGRSGDAFGDHEGESIEKPTVLLGFFLLCWQFFH